MKANRQPRDSRFQWLDSMSDGMCGYVEMHDVETGHTSKVRWSVTSEISTQGRAREIACERLAERADAQG